ncbi:hypothetical protein BJX64DRAFT_72769 [Aspergillus heterothallicus]
MASALQCPVKPSNTRNPHLVAFLGFWAPDDSKRLLQQFQSSLSDVNLILWQPHPEAQDTQANIHALSVATYRSGWSEVIVADGLTERQINGNTRGRESAKLSVVRVAVLARKQDEVQVIARRTAADNTGPVSLDASIGVPRHFEDGLVLRDPTRALFTPDLSLELAPGSSWPYNDADAAIPESILKGDESLNIFLLFPTTQDRRQTMELAIQQAVAQMRATDKAERRPVVHIEPWEHDRKPSRRDITRLWSAYTRHVNRTDCMHLLDSVPNSDFSRAQFITIYESETCPLIIARNTLETVIKESLKTSSRLSEISSTPLSQLTDVELLYDPDTPFTANPFPWKCPDTHAIDIPLFYLTDSLTLDQKRALKYEIQTPTSFDLDDELKVCTFVPFTSSETLIQTTDNTVARTWSTLFEMHTYKSQSPDSYTDPPYFFIDTQSGVDQTVIAVHTDKYSEPSTLVREAETGSAHDILVDITEPPISGLVYGRIPGRDAHNMYANLSLTNMDFGGVFEGREGEVRRVGRPSVPREGVEGSD